MLWRRKRNRPDPGQPQTVYDRVRQDLSVRWSGDPVTIGFDYQPYLKEATRRRVSVSALCANERGEVYLVGYCHDARDERSFRIGSLRGEVLVERVNRTLTAEDFVRELAEGRLDAD